MFTGGTNWVFDPWPPGEGKEHVGSIPGPKNSAEGSLIRQLATHSFWVLALGSGRGCIYLTWLYELALRKFFNLPYVQVTLSGKQPG